MRLRNFFNFQWGWTKELPPGVYDAKILSCKVEVDSKNRVILKDLKVEIIKEYLNAENR